MPTQPKITQPAFLLAGVLFTAIALVAIVALFMLRSAADVTTQEAGAGNTAPTVDTMYVAESSQGTDIGPAGIGAGFTTNEGLPKNIFVGGTITDLNGCHNLMQATVTLYRSGVLPGVSCTPDTNNCYRTTLNFPDDFDGCDTPEDTDVTFETSFSLPNYVDPTDAGSPYEPDTWVAAVNVADNAEEQMMLQESYEVNSLAAFSVPNAINYGTVALGGDSDEIQLTFSNTGNRDVDSDVIALHDPLAQPTPIEGDMVSNLSGFDNIPASAVHYSLTSGSAYGVGDTAVDKLNSTDLALALSQQTDDLTIPTTDTYWRLRMPASGVQGTYTNTVVFTAKAAGVVLPLDVLSSTDYSASGGVDLVYVTNMDTTAYITSDTNNSVIIMDVSDTANPVEISTVENTISNPTAITKSGDYVILSNQSSTNNLQIIDVSNTASPTIVSTTTVMDSGIKKVVVSGSYAYVIGYDSTSGDTFRIVDISNALSPSVVSGSGMNFTTSTGMDLQVWGYAYVYTSDATDGYLTSVDVSNASAPTVVNTLQTYKDAKLAVAGFYAFVVGNNSDFANTVQSIDISDPFVMTPVSSLSINNNAVNNVVLASNWLMVSDKGEEADSSNITLVNTQNPGMMLNAASTRVGAYNAAGTTYNVNTNLGYVFVGGKEDGRFYILQGPPAPPRGGGPVGFNGSVGKFASK